MNDLDTDLGDRNSYHWVASSTTRGHANSVMLLGRNPEPLNGAIRKKAPSQNMAAIFHKWNQNNSTW